MEEKDLKQIKSLLNEGFDGQARLVNSAFEEQTNHFDQKFNKLDGKIDLVKEGLKVDFARMETKLDRALYTELTHLEARVKRLEQKTGLANS